MIIPLRTDHVLLYYVVYVSNATKIKHIQCNYCLLLYNADKSAEKCAGDIKLYSEMLNLIVGTRIIYDKHQVYIYIWPAMCTHLSRSLINFTPRSRNYCFNNAQFVSPRERLSTLMIDEIRPRLQLATAARRKGGGRHNLEAREQTGRAKFGKTVSPAG